MSLSIRQRILTILASIFTILQILSNVNILNNNDGQQSKIIIRWTILVVLLMMIFSMEIFFKKPSLLFFVIISVLLSALIYKTNYSNMIFLFWMPYFAAGLGGLRFIKIDYITRIFTVLCVCVLSIYNVIPNTTILNSFGQSRQSLGFINPNGAAEMFLVVAMEALILKENEVKLINVVQTVLFALLMFVVTRSRTTILLFVLLIILTLLFRNRRISSSKITESIVFLLPATLMIISYLVVYLYKVDYDQTWQNINQLLSGRLYYANYYLSQYGINAGGSKFVTQYQIGSELINFGSLDNGYLSLLIKFGFIVAFSFVILYTVLIKQLFKEKYYFLIPSIIVFLILGLSETTFYYSSYNFTFYFFALVILKTRILKDETTS